MSSVQRWGRQYAANKSSGGGSWLKLENGETVLRVLSFKHTVTEGDFALGRYLTTEVKVGEVAEEFFLPYRSHFKPERGICGLIRRADKRLVGDCGMCNQAADLRKSNTKEDQAVARQWNARTQFNMQVVNVDEDPTKVQLWSAPQTFIDWFLKQMNGRAYVGKTLIGEKGMDILVTVDKQAKNPSGMYGFSFMPEASEVRLSSLKTQPIDLYRVADFVPPQFQSYIPSPIGLAGENGAATSAEAAPARSPRATATPAAAPVRAAEPATAAPVRRLVQGGLEAPAAAPATSGEAPVKRGRGRPPKAKPAPAPVEEIQEEIAEDMASDDEEVPGDDSIQVGKKIRFKNGAEIVEGVVKKDPDKDGFWDVEVANGEVFGVLTEEMILQ